MKIKDGFVLRQVAGSYIVVAVGQRVKEFNGVINLNETGAFVWDKLTKGATKEQLVSALLLEYDVDKKTAEEDVEMLIKKITEAGLLE